MFGREIVSFWPPDARAFPEILRISQKNTNRRTKNINSLTQIAYLFVYRETTIYNKERKMIINKKGDSSLFCKYSLHGM
jgi:hypothetical protein